VRKNTINLITIYMLIGTALNFIAVLGISYLDQMSVLQQSLTVLFVNFCIIVLLRDVAIKHDQICSKKYCKHHYHQDPVSGD